MQSLQAQLQAQQDAAANASADTHDSLLAEAQRAHSEAARARKTHTAWQAAVTAVIRQLCTQLEDVDSDLASAATLLRSDTVPPSARRGVRGSPEWSSTVRSPRHQPGATTTTAVSPAPPAAVTPRRGTASSRSALLSPAARLPTAQRIVALVESARAGIQAVVTASHAPSRSAAEACAPCVEVPSESSSPVGVEVEMWRVGSRAEGGTGRCDGFAAHVVSAVAAAAAAEAVASSTRDLRDVFEARVAALTQRHASALAQAQRATPAVDAARAEAAALKQALAASEAQAEALQRELAAATTCAAAAADAQARLSQLEGELAASADAHEQQLAALRKSHGLALEASQDAHRQELARLRQDGDARLGKVEAELRRVADLDREQALAACRDELAREARTAAYAHHAESEDKHRAARSHIDALRRRAAEATRQIEAMQAQLDGANERAQALEREVEAQRLAAVEAAREVHDEASRVASEQEASVLLAEQERVAAREQVPVEACATRWISSPHRQCGCACVPVSLCLWVWGCGCGCLWLWS